MGRHLASSEVYPLVIIIFFFFQSYMLTLFFSGLFSYLVGMKRVASRCPMCKRNNSYFIRYTHVLISPEVRGLPFG